MVLTGTSIDSSRKSLELAQTWLDETGTSNLYATVGVHPHDAKKWNDTTTLKEMRDMLQHPLAVAVGECGLDFNRHFSSKEDQLYAFKQQVKLAVELNKSIFVHEREAHADLIKVLDEVKQEDTNVEELPPIVVHCFTGEKEEALEYIDRGYYIGFTGTICKKERGAPLRELLPSIPLDRIMVETDAPFMSFKKKSRNSQPADCWDVTQRLAKTVDTPFTIVCDITTANALSFFDIDR